MAIVLKKKQPIDITKPGLSKIFAGLGWDPGLVNGKKVDCDLSAFMLGADNKIPSEDWFVFYNHQASPEGSVRSRGDNRDGVGDGDDEVIDVDLSAVPMEVVQILFVVTIDEAEERGHNFGNVRNASVRVVDASKDDEICNFTLTEQFAHADSLVIGRLYRDDKKWKFEAMGDAFGGGLGALVELYT